MYAPDYIFQWVKDPYQAVLLGTFGIWTDLLAEQRNARYGRRQVSLPSDVLLITNILYAWGVQKDEWVDFEPTTALPPSTESTSK